MQSYRSVLRSYGWRELSLAQSHLSCTHRRWERGQPEVVGTTSTASDWGQDAVLTPSPRKVDSVRKSAGFLACGLTLLSAPSQSWRPQWSPQISFRLQLRGSAGSAPASLVTGKPCDALTFAIRGVVVLYTTDPALVCQCKLACRAGSCVAVPDDPCKPTLADLEDKRGACRQIDEAMRVRHFLSVNGDGTLHNEAAGLAV